MIRLHYSTPGKTIDKLNTDIGKRIDKLDGKIFPVSDKLPFAYVIGKGIDGFHAQVRKTLYDLYPYIGKGIDDPYLPGQADALIISIAVDGGRCQRGCLDTEQTDNQQENPQDWHE
jgi:hypothetical protein